jgi:hypothetical protein
MAEPSEPFSPTRRAQATPKLQLLEKASQKTALVLAMVKYAQKRW